MQADSLSAVSRELFSRLDAVVAATTPAAQAAWQSVVLQQRLVGIGLCLLPLVFGSLFLKLNAFRRSLNDKSRVSEFDDFVGGTGTVMMAVATTISVVLFVLVGVPKVINPEYSAIVGLLNLVK